MRHVERAEQLQALINEHEMDQEFRDRGLMGIDGMYNQ